MKFLGEEFERIMQEIEIKKQLKDMSEYFQKNQNKCEKLLKIHKNYIEKNNLDKKILLYLKCNSNFEQILFKI